MLLNWDGHRQRKDGSGFANQMTPELNPAPNPQAKKHTQTKSLQTTSKCHWVCTVLLHHFQVMSGAAPSMPALPKSETSMLGTCSWSFWITQASKAGVPNATQKWHRCVVGVNNWNSNWSYLGIVHEEPWFASFRLQTWTGQSPVAHPYSLVYDNCKTTFTHFNKDYLIFCKASQS